MTVLQALTSHYERLRARGEAPPYGYSRERIACVVVLSQGGEVVDLSTSVDASGKAAGPVRCHVPQAVRRTSAPVANFLWDKTAYVLGVKRDPVTSGAGPAPREHHAFRTFHETLLAGTGDDGLRALLRFLHAWEPHEYALLPDAEAMLDTKVIFRLDGDAQWLHERPAARRAWRDHLACTAPAQGVCLVTGERAPVARVHPLIKGVRGTRASGAALVTFSLDSFESYGKTQGANAPVSVEAAFAYATALNTLLASDSGRSASIGGMTVVFWTDASAGERAATVGEAMCTSAVVGPSAGALAGNAVECTLDAIARGGPPGTAARDVPAGTRFHILGLAANGGRLSVRLWHVDAFGAFACRIVEHFEDLRLEPAPWRAPPSARRLLLETTGRRTTDQISPSLAAALLRAILSGARYPRTLLARVVARIRADKAVNGMRAAICRACLARDHRLGFEHKGAPVSLNRDETHPAYRLGRLFAVYERLQRAALGTVNASIRDRYFGAASATPAAVFPLLARKSAHHLSTLRRNERRRRLAHWFEREIDAILEGLGTTFPRSLRLEDQGRFALGYHHQRMVKRTSVDKEDNGSHDTSADRD